MPRTPELKTNPLVRFSSFFFVRWRLTLILWLLISMSALAVYHNLIKREGFPPVQFPITVVSGNYFVDDAQQVDQEIVQPLLEAFTTVPQIQKTTATAGANFFNLIVVFEDQVLPETGRDWLAQAASQAELVPEGVSPDYQAIDIDGFLGEYDLLLSVYSLQEVAPAELDQVAAYVAAQLESDAQLTNADPQFLETSSFNPDSAEPQTRQTSFNYLGLAGPDEFGFYPAVTVGLDRVETSDLDIIEFSEYVQSRLEQLDLSRFGRHFKLRIAADWATGVSNQIAGLESNLLSGLIAVTIVSFLLITWRTALITAIFMVSVMLLSILILYLLGFSLNTITLFALVLALGLFVDDATIVVEAIEAGRQDIRQPLAVVKTALKRVAAASFAGTMTTVLVFAPMLFTTGILGQFVRILPVTVIIALITSLFLSLSLIPFLSRFVILSSARVHNLSPIGRLQQQLAAKLANKIRLLKKANQGRGFALAMLSLSVLMVLAAGFFAHKLSFNIFPPAKDGDRLSLQVDFPGDYDLARAENVTRQINDLTADSLQGNLSRVIYVQANRRQVEAFIELTTFSERLLKAPHLAASLQERLDQSLPEQVAAKVSLVNPGPRTSEFPFRVQVFDEDPQRGRALAAEIEDHLKQALVRRPNGTSAEIVETRSPPTTIVRYDGRTAYVVQAAFDDDDTSALVQAAQQLVEDKFDQAYLATNDYPVEALGFDFGTESDNADSFKSLALVFPIALLAMFILLALQLRSLLQPLLVFLAIPFSLLGVTASLYLSGNAFGFFVQLGFIGLIGIAVNNTILLTDYANQARRAGARPIEAVAAATEQRFRPLLATSLTTMVALLPLALVDPFWQALSLTIIFGLLSSTFLVILAFPYYWLLAERLRARYSRQQGLMITLEIILAIVAFILLPPWLLMAAVVALIALLIYQKYAKL